jgi:hypothetical protein
MEPTPANKPLARFTRLAAIARALSLGLAVWSAPTAASAETYLVNGILSATPIGYGFKNLKQKLPSARLFNNLFGGEGSIRRTILADIRTRHAANPEEEFTLAGISSGADVVLQVARELSGDGIEIHYLAIVESSGGTLPPNVVSADNFICAHTGPLCTRAIVAGANTIVIDTSHIDLGNNPAVHNRIIANAR